MMLTDRWRVSPISSVHPDPNQKVADYDMNTWASIRTGELRNFKNGTYAIYRATFRPYQVIRKNGGFIVMKGVVGKAEIWLDGKLIKNKTSFEKQDLKISIPASEGERQISVLIEGEQGKSGGLDGKVTVHEID